MQYAIHKKINGVVANRLSERFFPSLPEARLYLNDEVGRSLWGTGGDYSIEPYDSSGNRLLKLNLAEQQAAAAMSKDLLQQDPALSQAVGVMIAARRLYVTGYTELHRRFREEWGDKDISPDVLDLWTQVAADTAEKVFETTELLLGLGSSVDWLQHIIKRDVEVDRQEKQQQREAVEVSRRASPLLLPYPIMLNSGDHLAWPRQKSITLIGEQALVLSALNRINQSLSGATGDAVRWRILRFSLEIPSQAVPATDLTVHVDPRDWRDCCRTAAALEDLIKVCNRRLKSPVDVIIVEDLSAAYAGLVGNNNLLLRAGEAHRRLHSWAKQAGACLISGLVTGDQSLDLKSAAAERLRSFSTVRVVTEEWPPQSS